MRVLVTGGAGFIGSAVCRHFIADLKHDVVVVKAHLRGKHGITGAGCFQLAVRVREA